MTRDFCILLLEDEPLILMDLEQAAQQRGCDTLIASKSSVAKRLIAFCEDRIDAAVLDVNLGRGSDCFEVIGELKRSDIPFVLHSGSNVRSKVKFREVDAPIIAKPAPIASVIDAALASAHSDRDVPANPALRAAD